MRYLNGNMGQVHMAIQRHVEKRHLAWSTGDCQAKPAAGS